MKIESKSGCLKDNVWEIYRINERYEFFDLGNFGGRKIIFGNLSRNEIVVDKIEIEGVKGG